jgi:hypothetical protein
VATSLLVLASDSDQTERLTVGDIAYGLSQLSPERLLPESGKPTEKRLLSALLGETDGKTALSREELKAQADVSEGSLSNLETLAAFDLVERTEDGRWRATLEPWWADGNDRDEPYERDMRETEPKQSNWQSVVDEAIHRSGKIEELSSEEYALLYLDNETLGDVLDELGWEQYMPFVREYCFEPLPDGEDAGRGVEDLEADSANSPVLDACRFGQVPDEFAESQQTLAAPSAVA